ncbi:STAS domain-containing protein [Bacillus sp. ISL-51]|uniref:STAS domain-containing protein n=1 Tax=Bacteria TaxID=2 RepID=UPI001BEC95CF|nr:MULTISPECIES: STAS domain-containing protein [Bacteria]MBT2575315.1 STAS domain-containing protein [Bacillus sp. ISL-51]MBT2712951.1 STAS domain-containing protein [Pseudomonas sp. ISL-88]
MPKNIQLYDYLMQHAEEISKTWFETIHETDQNSVYASSDPAVIANLKKQNLAFNYQINRIFSDNEEAYTSALKEWAFEAAQDEDHLKTPIHYIIREFIRVRDLYVGYVKQFIRLHPDIMTTEHAEDTFHTLIKSFDLVIHIFIEEMYKNTNTQLEAQKELITELSSPVIVLFHNVGLLPLIGDIDTARAKHIMENTLHQCVQKQITQLYIDLSGVAMIDTMVAQQLFSLIESLGILGVASTLSGIRPEIAQTAVQLGLTFTEISVRSSLAEAIASDLKLKKV